MAPSARRPLVLAGCICIPVGLAAAAFYAAALSHQPGQDFMVFHTAARAWLDGDLALIFDGPRFTAHINNTFAAWLKHPLTFHPWLYPPHFLLLLLPFGLLPFGLSYALFVLATFAAAFAAIWHFARSGDRRRITGAALLLAPATSFTIGVGNNGFLSSALLVAGFGLVARMPWAGGALLGLLTYKPQLWFLVPVALVAARRWSALASAVGVASLLCVLSLAVFGVEAWRAWIALMLHPPGDWTEAGRLYDESVFTCLTLLGASPARANAAQAAVAVVAAGVVFWAFRHRMPEDARLALLLAAVILAAPHVANSDAVMLAIAAAMAFCRVLDDGFAPGDLVVPVLVWSFQLFNPPRVIALGLLTPVLTLLLIAGLVRRGLASSRIPERGAFAEPAEAEP